MSRDDKEAEDNESFNDPDSETDWQTVEVREVFGEGVGCEFESGPVPARSSDACQASTE